MIAEGFPIWKQWKVHGRNNLGWGCALFIYEAANNVLRLEIHCIDLSDVLPFLLMLESFLAVNGANSFVKSHRLKYSVADWLDYDVALFPLPHRHRTDNFCIMNRSRPVPWHREASGG